ncbi:4-hydroxy-tetrahydrodipicolinate synthase [Caviibacter abscessus]|uniref:4-hydroxy-tetrahydrodipicolinate synthase n=1 Tax=Caviibacter abscessus TaxID=1766719 RepID=UPI0008389DDA|nr:4-hydroxy-tetrahydrodipicolinate synthase [Caviibacter abscessus]
MKLKGAYVAIITPFKEDLSVDYDKLEELVEFQISNGISGIVVCGTTGETPTLNEIEYEHVIKTVVNKVNKRVVVIAGAGANNTQKAVELTRKCKDIGADYVLSTCPYYNKPTQKGIIAHYSEIAKVGIPIIIYNVPGRVGVNITPTTIFELSKIPNIIGLKEASGNIEQMIEVKKLCKDSLELLSGDDPLILPARVLGFEGVISVVANVIPDKISMFYNTPLDKTYEIHEYLYDISKNMFIEGNPVTIKEAMDILGLAKNTLRLPLVKASEDTRQRLIELFREKGLLI